MRFLVLTLSASGFGLAPVQAHVGHLGEVAGHDHWVAGAAIGAAAAITLWGVLKGKKGKSDEQSEPEEQDSEKESA